MKNKIYVVLLIISAFFLQNCVSFEKNLTNNFPLNKNNLLKINGRYEILNLNADSISKPYWINNNFLTAIDRKLLKDTLKIDASKIYNFELSIINEKSLKIKYIENEKIIRERIIKTRLNKDGYLYLKNKNIGFKLIPYIFGGIDIKKTRISKSENGNLILDVANHTSGAALLVVFLDGKTWKYRNEYKKLN